MPKVLYVCVGSVDNPRSPIWKLWTQGDEFYAQQSDGTQIHKLSVHSSGICRLAEVDRKSSARIEVDLDEDPHVIGRWKIAPIGNSDATPCFALMVPGVYVGPRVSVLDPEGKRVGRAVWARAASVGNCVDIACVRLPPGEDPSPEHDVLGVLDLRDGSKIWVARSERKLTADSFANFQRELSGAVFTLDGPRDESLFAHLLIVSRSHPFPAIWDMAFGRYNVRSSKN